jgi:hypothetical protein
MPAAAIVKFRHAATPGALIARRLPTHRCSLSKGERSAHDCVTAGSIFANKQSPELTVSALPLSGVAGPQCNISALMSRRSDIEFSDIVNAA